MIDERGFIKPLPSWLNLDAVVTTEDRVRIEECGKAASKLLDAVLAFTDEWGPFYARVNRATWDGLMGDTEGLGECVREHLYLRLIVGPLELIDAAVAWFQGDKARNLDYMETIESSTVADQQQKLLALKALSDRGGDGVNPYEF